MQPKPERLLDPKLCESYIHTPLPDPSKHIRLITFGGGSNGFEILSLSTWHLKELPKYTAISYTWGPVKIVPVLVDGRTLQIRTNCYTVLKQAWKLAKTAYIWIDSICIDQEGDLGEKNAQVSMMYKIYRRATEVLVCIGEHEGGSERLMAVIRALSHPLRIISRDASQWRTRFFWRTLFATLGSSEVEDLLVLLENLESRPYFKRLWIVFFAPSLAAFVEGNRDLRLDDGHKLPYLSTTCFDLAVRPNMESIFLRFGVQHLCFDPRDRLFGMISFLNTTTSDLPVPPVDYSKSKLDIALDLAPFYDSDQIRAMLAAFGLTARSEEMQQLVQELSGKWPIDLSSTDAKPLTIRHENEALRLRIGPSKELEADFDTFWLPNGVANLARLEELESAFNSPEMYFSSILAHRVPKKVFSKGRVAAIVDAAAEPGDLLTSLTAIPAGEMNNLLLLRPVPEDVNGYVIVGQGVAFYKFGMNSMGAQPCQCKAADQIQHTRFEMSHELDLSTEEGLAYIGQDFIGPDYYHTGFDIDKRLERLANCPIPTLSTERVLKARVLRCYAHKASANADASDSEPQTEVRTPTTNDDDGANDDRDDDNDDEVEEEDQESSDDSTGYGSIGTSSDEDIDLGDVSGMSMTEKYRAWQIKKFGNHKGYNDLRQDYDEAQAKRQRIS
ncbi:Heterokaryon incompatibility protein 6, OR allele [Pseudocercospora fuligena]|uniref:Heterokaryon incompatibility protein 6, OR allele n=1 Tax=Pseudocercospora fuligena TaxID=685502 RepID=A0A8H6VHT6_9PEZI|nr:Heterokaryon incompatibility protein 6, OR allele [Pseudocercospora fuligena]